MSLASSTCVSRVWWAHASCITTCFIPFILCHSKRIHETMLGGSSYWVYWFKLATTELLLSFYEPFTPEICLSACLVRFITFLYDLRWHYYLNSLSLLRPSHSALHATLDSNSNSFSILVPKKSKPHLPEKPHWYWHDSIQNQLMIFTKVSNIHCRL